MSKVFDQAFQHDRFGFLQLRICYDKITLPPEQPPTPGGQLVSTHLLDLLGGTAPINSPSTQHGVTSFPIDGTLPPIVHLGETSSFPNTECGRVGGKPITTPNGGGDPTSLLSGAETRCVTHFSSRVTCKGFLNVMVNSHTLVNSTAL